MDNSLRNPSTKLWAIQLRWSKFWDGPSPTLLWDGTKPLVFDTRAATRKYIAWRKVRAGFGFAIPRPVRVNVTVELDEK